MTGIGIFVAQRPWYPASWKIGLRQYQGADYYWIGPFALVVEVDHDR